MVRPFVFSRVCSSRSRDFHPCACMVTEMRNFPLYPNDLLPTPSTRALTPCSRTNSQEPHTWNRLDLLDPHPLHCQSAPNFHYPLFRVASFTSTPFSSRLRFFTENFSLAWNFHCDERTQFSHIFSLKLFRGSAFSLFCTGTIATYTVLWTIIGKFLDT